MAAAAVVLPEFSLIVLGVVLRRWAWRAPGFWVDLERLVYFVLFPALLVRTTLAADLAAGGTGSALLAALGALAAGALVGALVRWFPGVDRVTAASGWQTAFRFNTFLALALVDDRGPAALALMGVLLGVTVPAVNVLAVVALANGTATTSGRGAVLGALGAVVRNPLIVATVVGLLGNVAGLALPDPVDATLGRIAAAAVPLGLLTVGAALRLRGMDRSGWLLSGFLAAVKLLVVPATALALVVLLGVEGDQRAVVLAFAVVPPATASYVLAARMGGNGGFVSAHISVATTAALVTVPLWLLLTG
ncbi:AEC family transporter [Blastococcus sp. MG754426]|uniref:AEC family transporter n=1 Tax=unclassified Blastococcus TaxID=2619396 RepID=UPI001EEF878D|nr:MULTISPECIES: AEC family transporter [unclassified Blastococcus]MCF6507018.1 AEC family transporter [Blastococcus sp. MG754426]MCF6511683.1 AEC family transporter [Blastococcus sp. MG754427]MCF6735518.1 AEC family transporter [Blastococcus sp. KM273129]